MGATPINLELRTQRSQACVADLENGRTGSQDMTSGQKPSLYRIMIVNEIVTKQYIKNNNYKNHTKTKNTKDDEHAPAKIAAPLLRHQ